MRHPAAAGLLWVGWALSSLAFSQSVPLPLDESYFDLSASDAASEARLGQRVQLEVPGRQGLSLSKSVWRLAPGNTTDCFQVQNGSSSAPGVPFDLTSSFAAARYTGEGNPISDDLYSFAGELSWNDARLQQAQRGSGLPLVCVNRAIMSVFVNNTSQWLLSVRLDTPDTGLPPLLLANRFPNTVAQPRSFAPSYLTSSQPLSLAQGQRSSRGWLDGYLLYGFLFENGQIPRSYEVSLSLELIDLASP